MRKSTRYTRDMRVANMVPRHTLYEEPGHGEWRVRANSAKYDETQNASGQDIAILR